MTARSARTVARLVNMSRTLHPRVRLLGLALPIVVADQLLKEVAVRRLEGGPGVSLISTVLRLDVVRNSGAAFSLGAGRATLVFTVLALAVCAALVVFASRLPGGLGRAAAVLLLAGTAGNLVDRLLRDPGAGRGHVVDYIHIVNFPIFNLSDIAITASVVCYLIASLGSGAGRP